MMGIQSGRRTTRARLSHREHTAKRRPVNPGSREGQINNNHDMALITTGIEINTISDIIHGTWSRNLKTSRDCLKGRTSPNPLERVLPTPTFADMIQNNETSERIVLSLPTQ